MRRRVSYRWRALAVVIAGALAFPAVVTAQTETGQARAVQATVTSVLGTSTTTLADTGTLAGPGDARDATNNIGSIPSLFVGEVLSAVTMGWPDQVVSEVSLTNVGALAGTTSITADTVIANVLATLAAPATASSLIGNLSINGVPVAITGAPNQTIPIAGGWVVINEQSFSAAGTTVNAIHATVAGVADVVIGSATAGIR